MSNPATPLVSVIIPLYNQAAFVEETISSVIAQTYTSWECIIVNDGSTDNSLEIAENLSKTNIKLHVINKKNGGLSSARNVGITKANGKYIVALDADDIIANNYIAICVAALEKNKEAKVAYTRVQRFGTITEELSLLPFTLQNMVLQCPFYCAAMYYKKDWERVGGYDESMKTALEDWDFWINILKDGGEVEFIDTYGFYYRIKPVSMINSFNKEKRLTIYNYLSTKHAQFFAENLGGSLMYYKMYIDAQAKVQMIEKWIPANILKSLRKIRTAK